ncbi:ABA4-like family protein [Blastomonas sp. AAP53]|uniref:ABA4-like family protein n=1 Tax=Blastomonas sp. AAP53 TaxID=1248760 RepID=UPI0003129118|nr:ABA4-like family protein [Blastomonas sp. AAP53]
MWEQIFGAANLLAMIAWAVLILAPRRESVMRALFFGPVLLLALGYATGLTLVMTGVVPTDGGADFSTIAGVRSIFASDPGVTIGWVHYLTFDLFVGLWIARNADAHGLGTWKGRLIQAPILFFTFAAGPFGLALYITVRAIFLRRASAHLIPT